MLRMKLTLMWIVRSHKKIDGVQKHNKKSFSLEAFWKMFKLFQRLLTPPMVSILYQFYGFPFHWQVLM